MAIGTRGLELGVAGVEEGASAREEEETGSLYKGPEYWASPLGSLKLTYHQGVVPRGRLGYPRLQ